MTKITHHKVVSALPSTLEADAVYYVRVGTGFDVYVTNSLGTVVAYEVNKPSRVSLGIDNVDNTRDADKPISTAVSEALLLKLNTSGGTLTGNLNAGTNTITGNIKHNSGYFEIRPYGPTYDDGSFVRSYWDGTDRRLRFAQAGAGTGTVTFAGVEIAGNSATATTLATSRTINGVAFDGSANITIPTIDSSKEPVIAAGTTSQFWRGDKTWQDTDKAVRDSVLTGLSTATSTAVVATDSVLVGIGKLQAQASLRAPLASPALTGTPTAPTATAGTNTTQIATTAFVTTAVSNKLDANATAVAAAKLATSRLINGVAFDGTADITITATDSSKEPEITAGTTSQFWRGDKTWTDFATTVRSSVLTGLSTATSTAVAATDSVLVGIGKLQAQVSLRAPLASPALTGAPTAPTATAGTNTTQIATTAFVTTAVSGKLDSTGVAASASKLATARTINGEAFDGTADITITAAANGGTSAACSGNAATATALQTARTINGVSFNGTANITVADATKLPLAGGTMTGVLTLPVGSAAAPSLTFSGDTDTGLYRVAANAVGIATAGTVAVDFDAVGNTNVYGRLRSTGSLSSASWTTTGCTFDLAAATFTDTSSAAAAVVATRAAATVNVPTFASTNAITVTNAATFYVGNRPTAGTNTTITNGWAIWVNAGNSRFGGDVTATGNISQTSDARTKTDVQVIENALSKVHQITGIVYKSLLSGDRSTGVIAQDVQKVLPEAVVDGEMLSVAYGNMMGLLIEAIKELDHKVEALLKEGK